MSTRRWLQIALFVLTSTLEVHVRAEELLNFLESKTPLQVPENCLIESSVCTVKTLRRQKFQMNLEEAHVVLSELSAYTRHGQKSGELVAGAVLIRARSVFQLKTPYGKVTVNNGDALVQTEQRRTVVTALVGDIRLEPKGHGDTVRVPTGQQNWIGRVNSKGLATIGIPIAYDYDHIIKDLAPVFGGASSKFISYARELREFWLAAVNESAFAHEALAQRSLAAEALREKQQVEAHKRWQHERDQLRSMLFKRTFE